MACLHPVRAPNIYVLHVGAEYIAVVVVLCFETLGGSCVAQFHPSGGRIDIVFGAKRDLLQSKVDVNTHTFVGPSRI